MALKSTIFKAELQVNDLDRHYYQTHALTLARHPSETDERMMARVLAFALHADDALDFGKGLSASYEPDLWRKDLTGAIELWIEVGLPEVKRLRRAAGRARRVAVYSYGRNAELWWTQNRAELESIAHLSVFRLAIATSQALAGIAERSMRLLCTIQDGDVTLSGDDSTVQIDIATLKAAPAPQPAASRARR